MQDNQFYDHKRVLKDITIKSINRIRSQLLDTSSFFEPSVIQSRLQEEIDKNDEEDNIIVKEMRHHIYDDLKNVPILPRSKIFSNFINVENYIVYLGTNPTKKDELNKLLISFLNSHDGIIVYGIDVNTERLVGMKMNRKMRDKFRQIFNSEYINYLMEYDGNIKYKFYDIDKTDLCILVIKVKKVKDNLMLFDPYNKSYIIRQRFLDKLKANPNEGLKMSDIILLDMKEFISLAKERVEKYYSKKLGINNY
jgi:hypothetical protein